MEEQQEASTDPGETTAFNQAVLTIQLVQTAIAGGVFLFGGVIAFLYVNRGPAGPGPVNHDLEAMLSLIHAGLFFACIMAGVITYRSMLRRETILAVVNRTSCRGGSEGTKFPTVRVLTQIGVAFIVRLALLEGPALFGLIIVMLAVLGNGEPFVAAPYLLLNLLSPAFFLLFVVGTFPTRSRLERIVSEKLQGG